MVGSICDTCWAPWASYGVTTLTTWGLVRSCEIRASSLGLTVGSATPPSALKMTVMASPDCSGNLLWSSSWAALDSDPGVSKSVLNGPAPSLPTTPSPTKATSQRTRTIRRFR